MPGYSAAVLERVRNPQRVGTLPESAEVGTGEAGSLGRRTIARIQVRVQDGRIVEARFKVFGCSAAIAATGLVTEWLEGASLEDARRFTAERAWSIWPCRRSGRTWPASRWTPRGRRCAMRREGGTARRSRSPRARRGHHAPVVETARPAAAAHRHQGRRLLGLRYTFAFDGAPRATRPNLRGTGRREGVRGPAEPQAAGRHGPRLRRGQPDGHEFHSATRTRRARAAAARSFSTPRTLDPKPRRPQNLQDIAPKGLNEDIVRLISAKKDEPEWLLEWRLKAYRAWLKMTEPTWPNVNYDPIDYQAISYYSAPKRRRS